MRTQARIDLGAVRANVSVLADLAGTAQVMAVVKADAYGHGLVPCARAALAGGATWLGVAFLEEAAALREAGLQAPLLAWLFGADEDLRPAVRSGVDLGVYTVAELDRVARAAVAEGRPARVHLKADTGLSRGGAVPADWPALCASAAKAEADGGVEVVGVWSHLASAGAGPAHPATVRQATRFGEALEVAGQAGLRPEVRHLASSGALLTAPALRYDLVRVGVAVYGLSPLADVVPTQLGLRPAMTLVSSVAQVKRVPAGEGVSYGHLYVTTSETSLALVPLGYGDGVPRAAGNRASMLVRGTQRRIAGVVSMDQCVLDIGDDEVAAGDEVILFGPGDAGEPTAREWADALGTIDYEVVTRIGPRVPRVHVGEAG